MQEVLENGDKRRFIGWRERHTSKPVNGPLFELLECDLGGGGYFVKAQAVGVLLRFVSRVGELSLLGVDGIFPLGVNAIKVLAKHLVDSGRR